MNILTFTRLFPNEQQATHGVFVAHRADCLAARADCQVRVVAPVPFYPQFVPGPPEYVAYGRVPARERRGAIAVEHPRYPVIPGIGLRWQGGALAAVARRVIARLAREAPVDVIDAHYLYPDGFAAVEAGRRLGIPVVLNAVGSDVYGLPRLPGIRALTERTLRAATRIISVSRSIADGIVELGADRARISVVPYGIDAERFAPDPLGAEEVRTKLALAAGERLVLSVGRLHRMKGHDVLLDAIARMASRAGARNVRFVIVGEGRLREELAALARTRGVESRVTFVGAVENARLPAWYSAADLFCLPSRGEGHPNVLLEALACGTPAVATSVGAIPEMIGPDCGRVVPPEDPGALADALEAGLAAVREGRWTAAAARASVADRSWTHVAVETRRVFEESIALSRAVHAPAGNAADAAWMPATHSR